MIRLRKKRSCYRKKRDYTIVCRALRRRVIIDAMTGGLKKRGVNFIRAVHLMFHGRMMLYCMWKRRDNHDNRN